MIARVTRSEFAGGGYLQQDQPVIVTDALEAWRIAERWTPAYLASVAKTRRVTLSVARDERYLLNPSYDIRRSNTFENTEVEFGAAAQRLLDADATGHVYVMQQSIPHALPELMDNLVVPEWIAASRPMIHLWFGRRTASQLHFDYTHNLFAQLHGTKEFALFAPGQTGRLYPYHHDMATAHLSNLDPDRPDLDTYPDYAQAKPLRFTMQPGELLFMPAFWWHHVRAADVSVSVNFWWYPTLAQVIAAPNATRALPGFYAADRLAEFRQGFLDPAQLDFCAASALFLQHGRSWAAALFALAALDEATRDRIAPDGSARAPGCWLRQLADDLQPGRAALRDHASLTPAQRRAVDYSATLAAQIAQSHSDAAIDAAEVAALIDALRAHAHSGAEARA